MHSLKYGASIIDGCALGYGRGSGNAKTEIILMEMNRNYNEKYDFIHVANFGNKYLIKYKDCSINLCYNVVYALCSYLGCHVTYGIEIMDTYPEMELTKVFDILTEIKGKNKHMFYYKDLFMDIYNRDSMSINN